MGLGLPRLRSFGAQGASRSLCGGDAKVTIRELIQKAGVPRNLKRVRKSDVGHRSEFVPIFVFWRLAYIFFAYMFIA